MTFFSPSFLISALLLLSPSLLKAENFASQTSDQDMFNSSISALDLFMQAGRSQDIYNAARWMSEYDLYPPRAINRSQTLLKRNKETFDSYLSVREDIYGYEIIRNPLQTKINIEGAIQTEDGFTSEYSATLVYKFQRWRIKSLDIGQTQ